VDIKIDWNAGKREEKKTKKEKGIKTEKESKK